MKGVWLLLLSVACGKGAGPTASGGSATPSHPTVSGSRVPVLIERLRSKDENVRTKARDELREGEFAGDEGIEVLRASALDFGDPPGGIASTATQLVLAVRPEPRDTAVIEEMWPTWPSATKAPR
jgi:hypothetical protein